MTRPFKRRKTENVSISQCSNNISSFNTVRNNFTVADNRLEILTWLSPLEPSIRHQDVRTHRLDNVGGWLLQTEEFRTWCDYTRDEIEKVTVFCCGDPGVGKTYISSLVIDALCDQAVEEDAAVACFYFDFASRNEQTTASMLGALLRQIASGLDQIPKEIVEEFEDYKKTIGGRRLRLPEIVKMLQDITSSRRAFICVDALDECGAEHRLEVLGSLRQILQNSPRIRIFLTGRPQIRHEVERYLAGTLEVISVTTNKDDITAYLRARLEKDTTPDAMDSSLEADIVKDILENASEIFLLVSFNVDAILQEPTIHRRRRKLCEMKDGLGLSDVYDETLERIKAQGGEKARLGMAALMWVSHSERPLTADELCHALAVEIGCTDLNTENVPSVRTLQACCQGLMVVDKESSTVRLIHTTLQEYLSTQPGLFDRARSTMAEACLTYLNSQQVKELSTQRFPSVENAPFVEYSSVYWGIHAKMGLSDLAKSLALALFDQQDVHKYNIFARLLLNQVVGRHDINFLSMFTGLHCASLFGLVEVAAAFIEIKGCDINRRDHTDATPLVWAAKNGHEEVMKLLLGQEHIKPDRLGLARRSPLSFAAENGHEGVVKLLLERKDICLSKPSQWGKTPLWYATESGHEGAMKLLLEREDIDPNTPIYQGHTLLSRAAELGHVGVVKLLLERRDACPNGPSQWVGAPLFRAAGSGHEGAVRLLLEREDIDPNTSDTGQTPLSRACEYGHVGIVKLLLERRDVCPNKPSWGCETPLSYAIKSGHEGAVRLLLGREDIDPNATAYTERTPLSRACEYGHVGIVKLLLKRKDVSPNFSDRLGRTPLALAAERGKEGVVKLLLARNDVNPDTPDPTGRTPLHRAAKNGHEAVAKLLSHWNKMMPVPTS